MFHAWRTPPTDEQLKAAARRESDRIWAQVSQMGIHVELLAQQRLEELEASLKQDADRRQ
jgi:hypothetical protein